MVSGYLTHTEKLRIARELLRDHRSGLGHVTWLAQAFIDLTMANQMLEAALDRVEKEAGLCVK